MWFDRQKTAHLRRVYDLHVAVLVLTLDLLARGEHLWVVVAELQETLNASTRVLGTLTIVTVRQAHDEARALEIISQEDVEIRVELGLGSERAQYWTCDFSYVSVACRN